MSASASIIGLQEFLDDAISTGEETGCQLAIFEHGKLVANLAAGSGITTETLFPVFSVGKGLMTTAFHRVVEKGVISYDARVADLWPEFGCGGKENLLVWHILTHRTGMHQLPAGVSDRDLTNWNGMCGKLEQMKPEWTPGTKCAYQSLTYAWLLGEVARRADGRDFKTIIEDEVLKPLGLDKMFFFGTDKPFAAPDTAGISGGTPWTAQFIRKLEVRKAFIPSAAGLGSAYAIAKHYAALLDEIEGVRLLKPETVSNATSLRRAADDPAIDTWAKFGLGYALCGPTNNLGRMFGHGGALGAEGMADKETGIALGFTKNKVTPTHPVHPLRDRISRHLGLPIRRW